MILLTILLLASVLMLFMNSGAEIAFFSLGYKDLGNLRSKQYPATERIVQLLREPRLLLSSMLVGNMVFRLLIILLCNYLITEKSFPELAGIFLFVFRMVVAMVVLILFGELLPKVWASNNNIRFAFYSSYFVWINFLIFRGIGKSMAGISEKVEKALGKNNDVHARLEQIDQAITLSAEEGASEEEKNILKGIAQFGNVTVRRAMKSRLDVQGIEEKTSFQELKQKVEEQQYSRFPVYKESLDTILGMLHSKDLLPHLEKGNEFDWKTLIRPAFFIHEQMLVEDLLRAFQSKRTHFAIVVDEFGGTDGIITLEDILEEIVGEIRDEYDEEESVNVRIDEFNYIFEGKIMINEACKIMNLPNRVFDPIRGESETIAGLVLELAGEIPKANQALVAQDFTFTVLEVSMNRIQKVKITISIQQN
ncbi:MAG: gliding motility-associated protein GldE [Chitinophagia bacterium]|jgi:putative hemolysin|nr:gliding motility-associated protein GldE [Chitinophagia bacterium]